MDRSNDIIIARQVFARKAEVDARGHLDYCRRARKCEDMYLGGGLQWDAKVREQLESEGRPAHEINDIMSAINSVVGYQIANRMDIAYLPIGQGTDEATAKMFSKYAKSVLDKMGYRDLETEMFGDGLIQQRGWIDIRMNYSENTKGEIAGECFDTMDVSPDPDAATYDPDGWSDVLIHRWMTDRDIENRYGRDVAKLCKKHAEQYGRGSEGTSVGYVDQLERRGGFGDPHSSMWEGFNLYGQGLSYRVDQGLIRYLVIERQSFEFANTLTAEYPTGDLRIIEGMSREIIQEALAAGAHVSKRRMQRTRWETCVPEGVIFNEVTPYEHFTPVPYFPYFRRGRTRGLVDNAISPQEMTNKSVSAYSHIINSIANSGWAVEEESLINLTPEQLEARGHETGLIVIYKKGSQAPTKIQPTQPPTGIEKMIEFGAKGIQRVTGVNESLLGAGEADMSGVALQSRQFAAQQQFAVPLWRLSQTRRMIATRIQKLIQRFMITERVARVTSTDEFGIERHETLTVNQVQEDGSVLYDLTAGEYDIAVTEQPMQVTFDNSNFEQVKEMREMGVAIPDAVLLRYSNLHDKDEVAQAIKDAAAQQGADPTAEAEAELAMARATAARAKAALDKATEVNKNAEAMFSATRVAQVVGAAPGLAALADMIYRSAGGIDQDASPVIPTPAAATPGLAPPVNTNPLTPDNPGAGIGAGSETLDAPTFPNEAPL